MKAMVVDTLIGKRRREVMDQAKKLIAWRHLVVVSVALNVAFMSKVVFEGRSSAEEQEILRFSPVVESSEKVVVMGDGSRKPAHVSVGSVSPAKGDGGGSGGGDGRVINLDHGDPTMYEQFWQKMGEKTTMVISGWQSMSYFSDTGNLCWFLEPEFAKEVIRLHKLVGNAVTEDRYIVVGTGSTQLYQAALYALSPPDASQPMSVVSAAPYYSSYPLMTDFLKAGIHKWAGDAHTFNDDGPYIELVTSPNNPDGFTREAVVDRSGGILIHDFAYYWPQYTPISSPANHDLMMFTVSKSTGHAGIRIGWALVKDKEVAKKMTKFIELNTIGVSKDSQVRASKILCAVSDNCENAGDLKGDEAFFEFSYKLMVQRWKQLRVAVKQSGLFSLPEFPLGYCNYFGRVSETLPAFAWMKCEGEVEDCESFLRSHKILTRGGKHFGSSPKYVRVSMLDRDQNFGLFVKRLSTLS